MSSALVQGATESLAARAERAPAVDLHRGDVWMSHKELAASGGYPVTDCDGAVVFTDLRGPIKEASCDRCPFIVTARLEDVRRSLQPREERWYQR